jgi:hypothetical protein
VTLQVHLIMQDSTDLDDPVMDDPIEEDVTASPAVPGDMECAEPRHDLVAGSGAGHVRAIRKLANGACQCVTIDSGLVYAEIPAVHFRMFAKSTSAAAPK